MQPQSLPLALPPLETASVLRINPITHLVPSRKNMHFIREINVALNSLKAMIPNACSSSVKTRCLSTPFCSQNPASLRRTWRLLNVMANWLFGEEHKSNKSMPISSRRKSFNKNPLLDGLFGTWHQTEPLRPKKGLCCAFPRSKMGPPWMNSITKTCVPQSSSWTRGTMQQFPAWQRANTGRQLRVAS